MSETTGKRRGRGKNKGRAGGKAGGREIVRHNTLAGHELGAAAAKQDQEPAGFSIRDKEHLQAKVAQLEQDLKQALDARVELTKEVSKAEESRLLANAGAAEAERRVEAVRAELREANRIGERQSEELYAKNERIAELEKALKAATDDAAREDKLSEKDIRIFELEQEMKELQDEFNDAKESMQQTIDHFSGLAAQRDRKIVELEATIEQLRASVPEVAVDDPPAAVDDPPATDDESTHESVDNESVDDSSDDSVDPSAHEPVHRSDFHLGGAWDQSAWSEHGSEHGSVALSNASSHIRNLYREMWEIDDDEGEFKEPLQLTKEALEATKKAPVGDETAAWINTLADEIVAKLRVIQATGADADPQLRVDVAALTKQIHTVVVKGPDLGSPLASPRTHVSERWSGRESSLHWPP